MIKDINYRYILARGKDIATNEEVTGLVHFDEYSPRESLTTLLTKDNELVTVDPVSVEIYTGLRCAVTGERIFEGDLVQLYSPIDATIVDEPCDPAFDFYGEICMPLNMVKGGARKRLYLYSSVDTPDAPSTEGFYQVASQWDAMEWVVVGRTSIENETPFEEGEKLADTILEQHNVLLNTDLEETMATTFGCKAGEVWHVSYGREWSDLPLFGTCKRRTHILRRLKEFFDGKKGVTFGKDLYDSKFDHLRMKWLADYQKYVVEPEAYYEKLDAKRQEEELKQQD